MAEKMVKSEAAEVREFMRWWKAQKKVSEREAFLRRMEALNHAPLKSL